MKRTPREVAIQKFKSEKVAEGAEIIEGGGPLWFLWDNLDDTIVYVNHTEKECLQWLEEEGLENTFDEVVGPRYSVTSEDFTYSYE